MDIEKLEYNPDDQHEAGVPQLDIYVAPLAEFLTIGKVPELSAAANFEAAGSIAEAHTFDPGKGFVKMHIIPDTGALDSENVGEKGNASFTSGLKGTLPGVTAKNIGFSRWALNRPFIAMVPTKDGKFRQVGTEISPAYFTEVKPTSGAKPGDPNGVAFALSDGTTVPGPFYPFAVTEKEFV